MTRVGGIVTIAMFAEYILLRSFYFMIPLVAIITAILTIRCKNCNTAIVDHRVAPYVKGSDLNVLAKCPVCGEAMLNET